MKIPFIIYMQAFVGYLVLSLPSMIEPVVYFISAWYAFTAGFVALILFALGFFILHLVKPAENIVLVTLLANVIISVAVAYKLLLWVTMPERDFWIMDGYTLFPLAAIISGWICIAINNKKISRHFASPADEGFETIFS